MLSDSEGEGVPTGPARFTVELLPFLDDTAFRVVLELGLVESTDFNIITESLKQQFSPKGNKLEWQHQLQTHSQQPGEQLVQYAGALRVLAYPNWTADQRGEVLRNHFIQGVSLPSVQLRLMCEMLATFDAALSFPQFNYMGCTRFLPSVLLSQFLIVLMHTVDLEIFVVKIFSWFA